MSVFHPVRRILFIGTICSGLLSAQQMQRCGSDEAIKHLSETSPAILRMQLEYYKQVESGLKKLDHRSALRTTDTTTTDTFWYDVPIVVHVVHDYGSEYLSDDEIFHNLDQWNKVYAGTNWDTSIVIAPFKKWVGIPRIRLHLATKDRFGNPTKGITRHRSYLTYNATDQAKIDDWPNSSYLNIWFTNGLQPVITPTGTFYPAAYAYWPSQADGIPFWDGVICIYNYISTDKTINHECGHVFNLLHPWGANNSASAGLCADGGTDYVDDTPPTLGHTSCSLFDTNCAKNYFAIYPSVLSPGTDSLVDYPDTTNVQNIMDYSYCDRMFTKGQAARMHDALNSSTAGRVNLWSSTNLQWTGALDARPDLPPIPAFAATDSLELTAGHFNYSLKAPVRYFIGTSDHPKARIRFLNESWNDTVSFVHWQFSNGALVGDITTIADSIIKDTTSDSAPSFFPSSYTWKYNSTVVNGFSQPGWVTLTLTATDTSGEALGRAHSTTTTVFPNAVFVADPTGANPDYYFQEFTPVSDRVKWPTFNYYNNEFTWHLDSLHGYYDHYCMAYKGFDSRLDPENGIYPYTGSPSGDFDDMFSIPFDLSGYNDSMNCNLNFMYSGSSRSATEVNDSLIIQASSDGGNAWYTLAIMKSEILENKGAVSQNYEPSNLEDWSAMTVNIPNDSRNLRGNYILFRFRYCPGSGVAGFSSGNNFYLDRINISPFPAAVSTIIPNKLQTSIAPNPATRNAFVIITNTTEGIAEISITDVTGKTIWQTSQLVHSGKTFIEIPEGTFAKGGVYIVRTSTNERESTQKLIVNK